ncbi:hypothetical protein MBRA1_001878 [Malassezia brasiliensis]|uniref:Borealin N-terminal domain-containing protein n=1 Tax=Malassezia brasiliensis TaxID=1821822 RepID=A0AAF0DUW2_9BASI|nr:hypothetical protein MBRA1_001878 [Malassezia brasiliensis]
MSSKRTRPATRLTEEQIDEVLANYDLECEKLLTRLERGAYRCVEAARAQMEARLHKIPQDVRNVSLQTYYDMHASTAGSERGRQLPPLAMASLPDAME